MSTHLLFIHALSPLHAGTGQGTSVSDLPIAREKATGIPYLPGSSVKGTLRDGFNVMGDGQSEASQQARARQWVIFGPNTEHADAFAGSVQFGDARLLLLPVRSLAGTFAWVTSPYLLQRFTREARIAGIDQLPLLPDPQPLGDQQTCAVVEGSSLVVSGFGKVVLEDLDLSPHEDHRLGMWAERLGTWIFSGEPDAHEWSVMLAKRLCVVSDDVLSFLLTTATEVFARVKLMEHTKTVQQGGLWYEEALPAETVLASVLVINSVASDRRKALDETHIVGDLTLATSQVLQFGGKATIGRGLCRVKLTGGI
jgi:CRISPR-associated protein Cmr4